MTIDWNADEVREKAYAYVLRRDNRTAAMLYDYANCIEKPHFWQPIETAPHDSDLLLVYMPDEDRGWMDTDWREDGVWVKHNEAHEHFIAVGGAGAAGPNCVCVGPSNDAPYTHWMPLQAPSHL